MKDICKIFLIFLFFTSCSKKSEKLETEKVKDTVSKIKTIKFKKSMAVVFPSALMWKRGWVNKDSRERGFFTPDEKTIKYIEKKLPEASTIIDHYWGEGQGWQKVFKINAKNTDLYDKQYFGYINSKKDSIVAITLFNFESNPYKIQERIEKEYISGSDGWFNTNTCMLEYNKCTKKFSSPMTD